MPRLTASLRARLWRAAQRTQITRHRQSLAVIRQEHTDCPVWVFPPGLGWEGQLFQRPQQLARALARQGCLVFYVEPEHARSASGFRRLEGSLYLCHVPLAAFAGLAQPFVHVMTWNTQYGRSFDGPRLVYDLVDDISAFEGQPARLAAQHQALLKSAVLVLATAERLHRQVLPARPDALLCPNGVDYELFAHPAGAESPPPDLEPVLAQGKPVIGYYGALARWFDYDLLKEVARQRSDLSFVLIGPDHDGSLPHSGLLEQPNLFWLCPRPYPEIPRYLRYFDVAAIPFRVSDLTHATSPLKLFEYMAGGKPVVITPMHESMRFEGVLVASGPQEFSSRLDQALALRGDPQYLQVIDRVARQNTWEARARQIRESLDDAI